MLALASLLTGILGLFSCIVTPLCWVPLGLIAVVSGQGALGEIRADPRQSGRSLAVAGIILGAIQLVLFVLLLIFIVLVIIAAARFGGS